MGETYKISLVVTGEDKASGPLNNVGGALGGIAKIAGGILSANLLTSVASGIAGLAKEALTSYADYERLTMSLQSLSARELMNNGSATDMADAMSQASKKAEDLQGWITSLAVKSPFNQKDVADSFRMSMAYGFQTDMAQRLTTAMVDYTAATGASGDVMSRISLALGKIKASGKLAGDEIMQLTEAGLPVRKILADSFNVTTAEIGDMISKGLIPADDAIEAIVSSMENDFGGAAEKQSATFSGLMSSLEDIKSIGLREFFEGTFKAIQPYLAKFTDFFSDPKTMEKISGFGEKIGGFIAGVLTNLPGLIEKVRPVFDTIGGLISGLMTNMPGLIDNVKGFIDSFINSEFVQTIISNISNAFTNLGTFWNDNGPGLVSQVSTFFQNIGETLGPLVANVIETVVGAFEKISGWFVANGPMIQNVLSVITTVIQFIAGAVANLFPIFQTVFGFAIDTIMNLATIILKVFSGDLQGALDTLIATFTNIFTTLWDTLQLIAVWILDTFFGMTFEQGKATVKQALEDVKTWFQNVANKASEIAGNITGWFNGVKDTIQGLIDKVKEFFKNIADAVIPDWVGALFGKGKGTPGKASGGQVLAGHSYLVGEKGPELFRPNLTGQIIPNNRIGLTGAGGDTINYNKTFQITVNNNGGSMNERDLAAALNQWEWAYGV